MEKNIYFCFGSGFVTKKEFDQHYISQLDEALQNPENEFIMGDYKGADTMCYEYLSQRSSNITIYCKKKTPRLTINQKINQ